VNTDVLKSDLFTTWIDSETGVTSYVLSKKVAPVQEAFYFVNNSMTPDGRYLWFYCAFPPSGTAAQGRTLGLIDFETGEVRHFPETQFNHATPYVDPDTGWVYWGMGDSLWQRGPEVGDEAECVNSLPEDLVGYRTVDRFATHLTPSADGKEFFVDAAFGLQWVFGSMPIDGSDYQVWHRFDRNFNHAQFSPTDPDLVLFSQENHPDPITGLRFRITDRMWLIRRGEAPRPIFDTPTVVTHEWWDMDGQHVWCIKPREGTWRVNVETQEIEDLSWPEGSWHSHNHASNHYVIGDTNAQFYRGCPSTVQFLNRETGRHIRVIDNPEMPGHVGKNYHIDPHPRFVGDGQLVVFTTTVRGTVDLAIAQTNALIDLTS
jgi:hypothetical protein